MSLRLSRAYGVQRTQGLPQGNGGENDQQDSISVRETVRLMKTFG